MFVWTGIENHPRTRAKTFDFGHIVHAKAAAFVQSAGMGNDVAPARPVDVEFDALVANGALRMKRVKSAPADQFDKLDEPNRYVSHGQQPHKCGRPANPSIGSKL
jgi:hypothetical protein